MSFALLKNGNLALVTNVFSDLEKVITEVEVAKGNVYTIHIVDNLKELEAILNQDKEDSDKVDAFAECINLEAKKIRNAATEAQNAGIEIAANWLKVFSGVKNNSIDFFNTIKTKIHDITKPE